MANQVTGILTFESTGETIKILDNTYWNTQYSNWGPVSEKIESIKIDNVTQQTIDYQYYMDAGTHTVEVVYDGNETPRPYSSEDYGTFSPFTNLPKVKSIRIEAGRIWNVPEFNLGLFGNCPNLESIYIAYPKNLKSTYSAPPPAWNIAPNCPKLVSMTGGDFIWDTSTSYNRGYLFFANGLWWLNQETDTCYLVCGCKTTEFNKHYYRASNDHYFKTRLVTGCLDGVDLSGRDYIKLGGWNDCRIDAEVFSGTGVTKFICAESSTPYYSSDSFKGVANNGIIYSNPDLVNLTNSSIISHSQYYLGYYNWLYYRMDPTITPNAAITSGETEVPSANTAENVLIIHSNVPLEYEITRGSSLIEVDVDENISVQDGWSSSALEHIYTVDYYYTVTYRWLSNNWSNLNNKTAEIRFSYSDEERSYYKDIELIQDKRSYVSSDFYLKPNKFVVDKNGGIYNLRFDWVRPNENVFDFIKEAEFTIIPYTRFVFQNYYWNEINHYWQHYLPVSYLDCDLGGDGGSGEGIVDLYEFYTPGTPTTYQINKNQRTYQISLPPVSSDTFYKFIVRVNSNTYEFPGWEFTNWSWAFFQCTRDTLPSAVWSSTRITTSDGNPKLFARDEGSDYYIRIKNNNTCTGEILGEGSLESPLLVTDFNYQSYDNSPSEVISGWRCKAQHLRAGRQMFHYYDIGPDGYPTQRGGFDFSINSWVIPMERRGMILDNFGPAYEIRIDDCDVWEYINQEWYEEYPDQETIKQHLKNYIGAESFMRGHCLVYQDVGTGEGIKIFPSKTAISKDGGNITFEVNNDSYIVTTELYYTTSGRFITVTVPPNTTIDVKNYYIYVSDGQHSPAAATISQEAGEFSIIPESPYYGASGGNKTAQISTDLEYDHISISSPNWVLNPVLNDNTFSFTLNPNYTTTTKSGDVVFTAYDDENNVLFVKNWTLGQDCTRFSCMSSVYTDYRAKTINLNLSISDNITAGMVTISESMSWMTPTLNISNSSFTATVTTNNESGRRYGTMTVTVKNPNTQDIILTKEILIYQYSPMTDPIYENRWYPIGTEAMFTVPTNDDFVDYTVLIKDKDDNTLETYTGRAYREPDGYINVCMNDIVDNYLSSDLSSVFPVSNFNVVDNYRLVAEITTNLGDTETFVFMNSWIREESMIPVDSLQPAMWWRGAVSEPISDKFDSRQYLVFSWNEFGLSPSYTINGTTTVLSTDTGNPLQVFADQIITTHPVTFSDAAGETFTYHPSCGDFALYYINAYGGWDSLLVKAKRTDNIQSYDYMKLRQFERGRYLNVITPTWDVYTDYGVRSDRMHHLLESPTVYLHNLETGDITKVLINETACEYKNRFANYTFKLVACLNNYRR